MSLVDDIKIKNTTNMSIMSDKGFVKYIRDNRLSIIKNSEPLLLSTLPGSANTSSLMGIIKETNVPYKYVELIKIINDIVDIDKTTLDKKIIFIPNEEYVNTLIKEYKQFNINATRVNK